MPKDPILDRTSYYLRRRGRPAGTAARERDDATMYVDFDWNLVNTNLGAMVEPRNMFFLPTSGGSGLTNLDLDEIAYNRRLEMSDNQTLNDGCHGGLQLPADFNTQ